MTSDTERVGHLPVSVVIPTIGRPKLLAQCLASVTACRPRAAEILVVDQSHSPEVTGVVQGFEDAGARLLLCPGTGKSRGANLGLREAAHDLVLFTDDDCTVDTSWVGVAAALMEEDPSGIVTGRVLPAGDPDKVPSTILDEAPSDYQGQALSGLLYWGNMAGSRSAILAIGGFDEHIRPNAADNDFCYRWLSAGRRLHYRPRLVVWHHEWRSTSELERLYVNYAIGQGMFYAKHLRQQDYRILRFVARDLRQGLLGVGARVRSGAQRSSDWRQGLLAGIPTGLYRGWRVFGQADGLRR